MLDIISDLKDKITITSSELYCTIYGSHEMKSKIPFNVLGQFKNNFKLLKEFGLFVCSRAAKFL